MIEILSGFKDAQPGVGNGEASETSDVRVRRVSSLKTGSQADLMCLLA